MGPQSHFSGDQEDNEGQSHSFLASVNSLQWPWDGSEQEELSNCLFDYPQEPNQTLNQKAL